MKKLVFIIDDDPVYLKFMNGHFRQMDEYQTQIYQTGGEAIKALDQHQPYLIILDHIFLNDPDQTGLEYLQLIRKKNSKVPVIYITAVDEEILRSKTKKLKVIDYLIKDDAFLVHLRTALDKLNSKPESKSLLKKLFGK
ncbi:MAG: response regulator [Flammeovirgaceae bacterium]|jgi:DNA-binding response OmpR family regulator|nr:response regulator [Flammeovirgaceae bacterium]